MTGLGCGAGRCGGSSGAERPPCPQLARVLVPRALGVGLPAAPLALVPCRPPVPLRGSAPPRSPRPPRPAAAQTVRRQGRDVTHS